MAEYNTQDATSDLAELINGIPTPAPTKSKAKDDPIGRREAIAGADRWRAARRVIFAYQRRCQACGALHTMPGEPLTEYIHRRDGTKRHASAGSPAPHLPAEVEAITGAPLAACHHCFNDASEVSHES